MKSIKDLWNWVLVTARDENVVFGFPVALLVILIAVQANVLAFIGLNLWFVIVFANSNED